MMGTVLYEDPEYAAGYDVFYHESPINVVHSRFGPGAVPGGSTKTFRWRFTGPKQDRRTCKGVSFRPVGCRRDRSAKHSCQRQ